MSERRQAAWDEAQRRYPTGDRQAGFVSGAAWADDNPPAVAALRAVIALHSPERDEELGIDVCMGCSTYDDATPHPCLTIKAINRTLGEE